MRPWLVGGSVLLLVGGASAQGAGPKDREAWMWASTCMACHGTGGESTGIGLRLKDIPAPTLYEKLLAFKNGSRPSTVMKKHVAGYSDEELRRIAQAFVESGMSQGR